MTYSSDLGYQSLNEEIVVNQLPIEGTIPAWLEGSLIRNGPAKFEVGPDKFRHWFDGFAMLHRFTFQSGNVAYANKFLQSDMYKISMKNGRISFAQFATDPCKAVFQGSMTESVNANVSIQKVAGDFVAMTEAPLPIAFNPRTLKTLKVARYDDNLVGHHGSAHPHFDFTNRMTVSYMIEFNMPSIFHIYSIKENEHRRQRIGDYTLLEPPYLHSFGMTANYVVIVEFPYRVNPLKFLQSNKPFIENYEWRPDEPAIFVVMRKDDGSIVNRFETPAFFSFHHINAFERDQEIIVDLTTYNSPNLINDLYLDKLTGKSTSETAEVGQTTNTAHGGEMRRYHMNLQNSHISHEVLSDEPIELPTINYRRYNAQDYGIAYGISSDKQHPEALANQLIRVDVRGTRGNNTTVWKQTNCYPGEPIFAAAPDATNEDDGVILSVVLNADRGNSFLLILDAHTFKEIGRAEVPHHIPFGFHGEYFPHLV